MKRSKSINLERMRKSRKRLPLKPLAAAVSISLLSACGNNSQQGAIYQSVAHCIAENPGEEFWCEEGYENALAKSHESGPKYNSRNNCEWDFGHDNCQALSLNGSNWWVPMMGGYILAEVVDEVGDFASAALYTSYSRRSPYYGQWSSVDGDLYGRIRYGKTKVSSKTFEPKPKVTKTMSRGGFGSKVAAKSSWGGKSSSKGGWGG